MVEYVPDMHIVERSSRSVRILADWCNGSTSDSDSENIGSIPVLAVKNIKEEYSFLYRKRDEFHFFCKKNTLERPHPTDVGWGFYGLAPVKPR